jgi:hypothetical protein
MALPHGVFEVWIVHDYAELWGIVHETLAWEPLPKTGQTKPLPGDWKKIYCGLLKLHGHWRS